jgi:hypothetical protein
MWRPHHNVVLLTRAAAQDEGQAVTALLVAAGQLIVGGMEQHGIVVLQDSGSLQVAMQQPRSALDAHSQISWKQQPS